MSALTLCKFESEEQAPQDDYVVIQSRFLVDGSTDWTTPDVLRMLYKFYFLQSWYDFHELGTKDDALAKFTELMGGPHCYLLDMGYGDPIYCWWFEWKKWRVGVAWDDRGVHIDVPKAFTPDAAEALMDDLTDMLYVTPLDKERLSSYIDTVGGVVPELASVLRARYLK